MRYLIRRVSQAIILFAFSHVLLGGFDEARLKKMAEQDGFGYKYANLVMVAELVVEFNDQKKL